MEASYRDCTDKTAVMSQDGHEITYKQLTALCGGFKGMCAMGDKRELLLIRCSISLGTVIGYAAALRNRIPIIMCDEDRYSEAIERYKPAYIWQSIHKEMPEGYSASDGMYGFILLKRCKRCAYEINEKLALLLSTSGSTGSGRYVRISYDNIKSNTEDIVRALRITNDNRAALMLPLGYTYGLSIVNTYLYAGASLIISEFPIIHQGFWDYFAECGGDSICGVPYTYELLRKLNIPEKKELKLSLATQAGGKLRADTEKYMLEAALRGKFNFAVMYGQTEATARISCHFLNEHPEKLGSVGRVIPNGKIYTRDGEIIYSGANVSMGYADNASDLSDGDNNNGVLRTGDLGYLDEDGYLYITGRKKRIAKITGKRINLAELEDILLSRFNICAVCIEHNDLLIILVQKEDGGRRGLCSLHEIAGYVSQAAGINRRFVKADIINKIPLNDNGKTDYPHIISEYEKREERA